MDSLIKIKNNINKLERELSELKKDNKSLIQEKDSIENMAYGLTVLIGDYLGKDFGEFSDTNDPVFNAIEHLENLLYQNL